MAAPLSNPLPLPIGRWLRWTRVRATSVRWALACGLCVPPLAAVLHHAIFVRGTCMLNNFGADYTPDVVAAWLSRDPSLCLAMLIALAAFQLGRRVPGIRPLALPFVLAFLPLTVWIWDIPFTGRAICRHLHDDRVLLAEGLPLRSRYLYFLGAALYGAQVAWLAWRHLAPARPSKPPATALPPAHWDDEHVHTAA